MKGLGGVPLGVFMACSGPSRAPPVATVPPNRCPRTVPSNTGRGSRRPGPRGNYCLIPSRRRYLLETIEARLRGGGGCERFREEFCCTRGGYGLYRFQSAWKTSSCSLLKLLSISVRPSIAIVCQCDIYRDIPT